MTENKRTRRIWIRSVRRDPPDVDLAGRAFIEVAAAEAQREADARSQANEQAQLNDVAQPHEKDAS